MKKEFNKSGKKRAGDWILPDFVLENCWKCKYNFPYSTGCQIKPLEQYPCKDFEKKEN
ncbi:hypothetical protein KAR91_83120 [Candidatus Pacearchaeota archaeon]|nr:hypothetical protein [Candidatus Pacearchaeota archaeon]